MADGEIQRGAQDGAQVLERGPGRVAAAAVGTGGDAVEAAGQPVVVQVGQADGAEERDEEQVDVAGVVQAGGGPDPGAGRQPVP